MSLESRITGDSPVRKAFRAFDDAKDDRRAQRVADRRALWQEMLREYTAAGRRDGAPGRGERDTPGTTLS